MSNAKEGHKFECRAQKALLIKEGLSLQLRYEVLCGLNNGNSPRLHAFDLGSENPKIIVECKAHNWMSKDKYPSAKMSNWVEAMFYFYVIPSDYRKIFIVKRSVHPRTKETLLSCFLDKKAHMIPPDVELMELDNDSDELIVHQF